jgi:multidrug efflux system membrane fusion protein
MNRMNKKTGSIVGKILFPALMISLLFAVQGCNGKKDEKDTVEKIKISTFIISKRVEQQRILVSGKLESSEQTNLAFKIGGRIASVSNDVGDFVKRNTVMAALDQDEISANVAQAELMYQKMKRDYDRVVQLYNDEAATKEQLQDITTAYNNAEQQMKVAKYNLELSRIAAPFDGYISMRRHEPGELVQAGDPVFIFVGKSSTLKVVSGIAGRYVVGVKPGTRVDVISDSVADKIFKGRIKRIGMAADYATGTFPIELEIVDNSSLLRPGMVVSAEIGLGKTKSMILIPPESLIEADEDRGYVFKYDQSSKKVRKLAVKLGGIINEMMVVTYGLKEGDEIVQEGAEYLTGGELVQKVDSVKLDDKGLTKGAGK